MGHDRPRSLELFTLNRCYILRNKMINLSRIKILEVCSQLQHHHPYTLNAPRSIDHIVGFLMPSRHTACDRKIDTILFVFMQLDTDLQSLT